MTALLGSDRGVRWVHPVAWWLWALAACASALATGNPLALVLIASAGIVVLGIHGTGPRSPMLVRLVALIIVLRIVMQVLLGGTMGTHVAVRLPEVGLPTVFSGLSLGGVITVESLLFAAVEGLRFATILIVFAAASVVAPPARLFRVLPPSMTAVASVFIITVTFIPHLLADAMRIRGTRRLRGRTTRGPRAAAALLVPVFDGALERSQTLAAAMASRGYGSGSVHRPSTASAIAVALLTAIAAAAVTNLVPVEVVAGSALILGAVVVSRLRKRRERSPARHRPDPWRRIEHLITATAAISLAGTAWAAGHAMTRTPVDPLTWPTLTLPYAASLLLLALPALLAPQLPGRRSA